MRTADPGEVMASLVGALFEILATLMIDRTRPAPPIPPDDPIPAAGARRKILAVARPPLARPDAGRGRR